MNYEGISGTAKDADKANMPVQHHPSLGCLGLKSLQAPILTILTPSNQDPKPSGPRRQEPQVRSTGFAHASTEVQTPF